MTSRLSQQLTIAEVYFRRACEQVVVLNRLAEEMTVKFSGADDDGNKCMRYNIRMRLSVLEGVRNMYYEYAAKKALDIVSLQRSMLRQLESATDEGSDSDMSVLEYGAGGSLLNDVSSDDDIAFC